MDDKNAVSVAERRRGMMLLLTGGSACGKSFYARALCSKAPGPRYYINAARYDAEDRAEAEARRAEGFHVIDHFTQLSSLRLPERGTAILECVCNLTANEMFDERGVSSDPFERVTGGVEALRGQCALLVVVTNDVGSGWQRHDGRTQAYIEALGRINAALASMADAVYELVCGIPLLISARQITNTQVKLTKEGWAQ